MQMSVTLLITYACVNFLAVDLHGIASEVQCSKISVLFGIENRRVLVH